MNQNPKKTFNKDFVPENSSMAKDLEEVKELGKQMEQMETAKELREEKDLISDPIQEKHL
ncbi:MULTISPECIES: hypothetical protein [Bacillus]|uniref:hypothetical protein n=1 Tax=Bacillus TaxID=1386 RepID=UPI0002D7F151|nr:MULTISPECIES: hypothetical protein [Bacillus]